MLNFVAKRFRTFIEITLWINLVFWPIFLGIMLGETTHRSTIYGYDSTSREFSPGGCFLGLIIGLLTDIIYGGLLATFLSIDKGVKNINKWLQCMWKHSNNINKDAKAGFISDDDIYYFEGYMRPSSHSDSKENFLG